MGEGADGTGDGGGGRGVIGGIVGNGVGIWGGVWIMIGPCAYAAAPSARHNSASRNLREVCGMDLFMARWNSFQNAAARMILQGISGRASHCETPFHKKMRVPRRVGTFSGKEWLKAKSNKQNIRC
jgi:hypothetical protein